LQTPVSSKEVTQEEYQETSEDHFPLPEPALHLPEIVLPFPEAEIPESSFFGSSGQTLVFNNPIYVGEKSPKIFQTQSVPFPSPFAFITPKPQLVFSQLLAQVFLVATMLKPL
jgi:hypothetical protein